MLQTILICHIFGIRFFYICTKNRLIMAKIIHVNLPESSINGEKRFSSSYIHHLSLSGNGTNTKCIIMQS